MTPFHVGMRVVCVEAINAPKQPSEIYPTCGAVYTIRDIGSYSEGIFIRLEEIINPKLHHFDEDGECEFGSEHFRPAHENRMDELRTLLAPVPSKAKTLSPVTS